MERKEKNLVERGTSKIMPKQIGAPTYKSNLNKIIRNNGYQKGKLFYSNNKATYTFLNGSEVISLHFDWVKRDLYLKGHKVTGWEIHPDLGEFLEKFKKALLNEPRTCDFVGKFDEALSRLDKI